MGILVFPLLLLFAIGPAPKASEATLADFSRFSKALNTAIALVDRDGTVREGILVASTIDDVTMRFGSGTKTFARADVMSAERLRDGRKDGAIKGAIFGALMGLLAAPLYEDGQQQAAGFVTAVALYGGIGWALDAAQNHREPIYRGTLAPAPAVKLSLRF